MSTSSVILKKAGRKVGVGTSRLKDLNDVPVTNRAEIFQSISFLSESALNQDDALLEKISMKSVIGKNY